MHPISHLWRRYSSDFWGGVAAMLVVLPASIAFGVTIYAFISPSYASFGALAGILGAMALGMIAPILGGTDRLISAPCAPAAAILSAFVIESVAKGTPPNTLILMMTMLVILAGLFQILLGFLKIGSLIKYLPYPVVSGYLSGVGLIIMTSQLPPFLGLADTHSWWESLLLPEHWQIPSLLIGGTTILAMMFSARVIKKLPSTIVGILAGLCAYALLAFFDPHLRTLENNHFVIGLFDAASPFGEDYFALISQRWDDLSAFRLADIFALIGAAATLAALLCIDTLKTSVILDQKTRTQHEPNRELIAQGAANITASLIGGIPGAGTMGASMVNFSSGGKTRISAFISGVLVILVALALGAFVAWMPVAALSGVLMVVGFRMIDFQVFRFLESKEAAVDFVVVLLVVGVAVTVGLIAASLTGVALSILLFLKEEVGGKVVRRRTKVAQRSSTWSRPDNERGILSAMGDAAVIFELQGSLFFGTAQQLYLAIQPEFSRVHYLILDFQRVQSIDVTAVQSLKLIRDALATHHATLLFSNVPKVLPNGRNLREFLELSGLVSEKNSLIYTQTLEEAIEWVEQHLLKLQLTKEHVGQPPLALPDIRLFQDHPPEILAELAALLEEKHWDSGETIYSLGEKNTHLYILRKGEVRVFNPVGTGSARKHVATLRRGEFFGTLGFLDGAPRGNDAIATRNSEAFALSREKFQALIKASQGQQEIAFLILKKLSQNLAIRLRHVEEELILLQEN